MPADTVTLLGKAERVVLPTNYRLLFELALGHSSATPVARTAVAAAMVVICCPDLSRMAAKAGLDYARAGYDPVAFGRQCHDWLHGQRVQLQEIVDAGMVLYPLISAAAFPTDAEVGEALGK